MKVKLAYGRGRLSVEVPKDRTTVIEPSVTAAPKADLYVAPTLDQLD